MHNCIIWIALLDNLLRTVKYLCMAFLRIIGMSMWVEAYSNHPVCAYICVCVCVCPLSLRGYENSLSRRAFNGKNKV